MHHQPNTPALWLHLVRHECPHRCRAADCHQFLLPFLETVLQNVITRSTSATYKYASHLFIYFLIIVYIVKDWEEARISVCVGVYCFLNNVTTSGIWFDHEHAKLTHSLFLSQLSWIKSCQTLFLWPSRRSEWCFCIKPDTTKTGVPPYSDLYGRYIGGCSCDCLLYKIRILTMITFKLNILSVTILKMSKIEVQNLLLHF